MAETTAWGDESIRIKGFKRPIYLLGASIVHRNADRARELLVALKPRHAAKLHWRDMDHAHQWVSIHTINTFDATHTIVVGMRTSLEKVERARRECLKHMLPLLLQEQISTYCMESRGQHNDQHDLDFLNILKRSTPLSTLTLTHVRPTDEPLVWIPDQVLGAYGNALAGESDYDRFIANKVLDETFTVS